MVSEADHTKTLVAEAGEATDGTPSAGSDSIQDDDDIILIESDSSEFHSFTLDDAVLFEGFDTSLFDIDSDLRPDNVLLDDKDNVVLCDFEQRGNWHEWSAPEVLFRQYMENIHTAAVENLAKLPAGCTMPGPISPLRLDEGPVQAANRPWFLFPSLKREKASVYTLGLFIYTVFEGTSGVRRDIANEYPIEPSVEFPTTILTPDNVLALIRHCTCDAVEWEDIQAIGRPRRVVRSRGMLYPEGRTHLEEGTVETASEVLDTAHVWWSYELGRAKAFFHSEVWRKGNYGQGRPSLRTVLRRLDEIHFDTTQQVAKEP